MGKSTRPRDRNEVWCVQEVVKVVCEKEVWKRIDDDNPMQPCCTSMGRIRNQQRELWVTQGIIRKRTFTAS